MQGATRRLKAWLIVALLEAFRYTAQETEAAVPRKRNGGFDVAQSLSFGQEKGNINGLAEASQWVWICSRTWEWQCRKLPAGAANAGVAPTVKYHTNWLFGDF